MKTHIYLIVWCICCAVVGNSQSNHYFINGQTLDALPPNLNWYAIHANQSIVKCNPELVSFSESDHNPKVLWADPDASLIIGTSLELPERENIEFPFEDKHVGPDSKFPLSDDEILFSNMSGSENGGNEDFRLVVFYKNFYEESIIFENCRPPTATTQQPLCGKLPFTIEFYGDLTNDGVPEMLLSADTEGGVMKLLIGKAGRGYKVLYVSEQ